jgi:predicted nucleotidyltransferase
MPELPGDWRDRVRRWARAYPAIKEVFVFGSRATGTAHAKSDLDLALNADLDDLITNRTAWVGELTDSLGLPVDLYPADGSTVAAAVAEHGFCVYARSREK